MPDVVVDIGNSRIKWGWCKAPDTMTVSRLDPDNPGDWQAERERLPFAKPIRWAVASVHPARLARFTEWCLARGDTVCTIASRHDVPITVAIREPDSVGLDRLLGAVAANACRRPNCPAITLDIGTAVTLNCIDSRGHFRGGAILPGPRLMAASLHQFTAKLPLVDVDQPAPESGCGETTDEAIRLGIQLSIQGAMIDFVSHVMMLLGVLRPRDIDYFLTGGGAAHFAPAQYQQIPTLNLEGIRIAAEAMS